MNVIFTAKSLKQLKKLPLAIQKKIRKQTHLLKDNKNHPSLRFRRMANTDIYEGRIDYQYRFIGIFDNGEFYITALGTHDKGLGKQ